MSWFKKQQKFYCSPKGVIYNSNDFIRKDDITGNPIHLFLGKKFNRPLDRFNKINTPLSIKHITFPDNYNHEFDLSSFPSNVEYIELGKEYSKPLTNLSKNVKYIKFNGNYHLKFKILRININDLIPTSVHKIHLNRDVFDNLQFPIKAFKLIFWLSLLLLFILLKLIIFNRYKIKLFLCDLPRRYIS